MKKLVLFSFAFLCSSLLVIPTNDAAAIVQGPKGTQVVVNNNDLDSKDILNKNNQVFFSLTSLKSLGGLTFAWNNTTKQVTVKGSDTNLQLTMNKKVAQKNGNSVSLSTAPFIHNGKTMIPLRFVAEALDGSVTWNQKTQTAFVSKPSTKLLTDIKSSELSTARNAAINLPRVSQLTEDFEASVEVASLQYYFPENTKDRFIEVNNNVIRYYQITKNTAYLKWQAFISEKAAKQDNLYFLNRSFTKENGSLPNFKDTTFANFRWMPHITSTGYGLINKENWNDVVFKEAEVPESDVKENYIIVDIPED
ncbi:copper amine oxidase N-terminal domain-containing protein [Paenibacillus xylanilyticus]|uniref:Copper amine oxidase N-terminal domain-containing protein n=1 Tax=Paenibacillus xylanilyticus TaxID=248903 RepID=A0A7Y6EYC9_9BACL|nr:copper amine oxidase N-terminal domain-containing protein [Paenibacillus xylanilyticus]NUU79811.1 copper amine oxidase N-terminal domain-containing protein [Paenibacillus xylanilyticus]